MEGYSASHNVTRYVMLYPIAAVIFLLAYLLLAYVVCELLASGTRQLEIDYPFTEAPPELPYDVPTVTLEIGEHEHREVKV